jgi:GNAT superfamily N-acetyltransferase
MESKEELLAKLEILEEQLAAITQSGQQPDIAQLAKIEKELTAIKEELQIVDNLETSAADALTLPDDEGYENRGVSFELSNDVADLEYLLAQKYSDFIADDPRDTVPFAQMSEGNPPFELTLINDTFLYVDLLTVKPEMQGQGGASQIMIEIIQFARENNLHVIAQPVNSTVQASMVRYGAQPFFGTFYFGGELEAATKAAIDAGIVDIQRTATEYQRFMQDMQGLTEQEVEEVLFIGDQSERTRNFMQRVAAGELDFRSYLVQYLPGVSENVTEEQLEEALSSTTRGRQAVYDKFKSELKKLGSSGNANFSRWLTNTFIGQNYLYILKVRMDDKDVTVTPEVLKQRIEEDLREFIETKDILNQNLEGVKSSLNSRDRITGELADEVYLENNFENSTAVSFKEITTKEIEILHAYLGTPTDRASFSIMSPSKLPLFIEPDHHSFQYPDMLHRTGDDSFVIYRSTNVVDAATGIRPWKISDDLGGRTAGLGSLSYASNNPDYPAEYMVDRNRVGRDIYAIEIKGVNPIQILNMDSPIRHSAALLELTNMSYAEAGGITLRNYQYLQNFSGAQLRAFYSQLKDYGFKVLLNATTGMGNAPSLNWVDGNGELFSYSAQRNRQTRYMATEVLVIDDTVQNKVLGTLKWHQNGYRLNPFNKDTAIQDEIQKLIKRAKTSLPQFETANFINSLQGLSNEIRHERNNMRPDIYNVSEPVSNRPSLQLDYKILGETLEQVNILRDNIDRFIANNPGPTIDGVDYQSLDEIVARVNMNLETQIRSQTPGLYETRTGEYVEVNKLRYMTDTSLAEDVGLEFEDGAIYDEANVNELKNYYLKQKVNLPNGGVHNKYWLITGVAEAADSLYVLDEYGVNTILPLTSDLSLEYMTDERQVVFDKYFDRNNNLAAGSTKKEYPSNLSGTFRNDLTLSDNLMHVLTQPYQNTIEIGMVHVSPRAPVSINDFVSGAEAYDSPIVNRQGEVRFDRIASDLRNRDGLYGMSLSFENDIIVNEYSRITGKPLQGVPNYFTVRLNSNNILTPNNLMSGSWFEKFDVFAAAQAVNASPRKVIDAMIASNLVEPSSTGYSSPFNSRLTPGRLVKQMTAVVETVTGASNKTLVTKFIRGGGIDGMIEHGHNMSYHNFPELMLIDPNDQMKIGRVTEIVDSTKELYDINKDQYKIVSPDEPPLRTVEEVNRNINQTKLDDAYSTRLNFQQEFKTTELEAMGLLDDVTIERINNSSLSNDAATDIVLAFQDVDIPTAFADDVIDAANVITMLGEDEYYNTLGKLERLQKSGQLGALSVEEIAERIAYETSLSSKSRAVQGVRNTLAHSIGKRGPRQTGLIALDIYELTLWGGALAYGTSEVWTTWFENINKKISNKVFNTNYTLSEPGQIDYEKLDKTIRFAENIDPFEIVVGPIIDDIQDYRTVNPRNPQAQASELIRTAPQVQLTDDMTVTDYGINADEISQGEPISKYQHFMSLGRARVLEDMEINKENHAEKWYSNYIDTGNNSYYQAYSQPDEDF